MKSENGRRRNLSIVFLFPILMSFPMLSSAQSLQEDIAFVLKEVPKQSRINLKHDGPPFSGWKEETSPVKFGFLGVIRVYQLLLSSQDVSLCNFSPSCSRFSGQAIRRAGLIKGILLTSDRLQRDIGFPGIHKHYTFDVSVGRFSDPVERYIRIPTEDKLDK